MEKVGSSSSNVLKRKSAKDDNERASTKDGCLWNVPHSLAHSQWTSLRVWFELFRTGLLSSASLYSLLPPYPLFQKHLFFGNKQLGIANNKTQNKPVLLCADPLISSICCGAYHSMVLKSNGALLVFGYNSSGQVLKIISFTNQSTIPFTLIHLQIINHSITLI